MILPIIVGYLLGSFLPAYFLPKWTRDINIFDVGDGNPGTSNVKKNIGVPYAVITGFYDVTKGILAMFIAGYFFHSPLYIINISGIAAILGHMFPFYLKFKGGCGVATAVGIFLVTSIKVSINNFKIMEIIITLSILLIYFIIIYFTTHNLDLFAVTFIPFFVILILVRVKLYEDIALLLIALFLIYKQAIYNFINKKE